MNETIFRQGGPSVQYGDWYQGARVAHQFSMETDTKGPGWPISSVWRLVPRGQGGPSVQYGDWYQGARVAHQFSMETGTKGPGWPISSVWRLVPRGPVREVRT